MARSKERIPSIDGAVGSLKANSGAVRWKRFSELQSDLSTFT